MSVRNAAEHIKRAVLSWEHTKAHPHRFGIDLRKNEKTMRVPANLSFWRFPVRRIYRKAKIAENLYD